MFNAASATSLVVLIWVFVGASCIGWGTLLMRCLCGEMPSSSIWQDRFWLGCSILLGLLELWHLFLPIDWRTTAALLGGGIVVGLPAGAFRRRAARSAPNWRWAAIGGLLALWFANRGLDLAKNYDSGLYHFATIRWINEYAVVPGLANMHDRLAFNQSYFLFVALLNAYPYFEQGYHVANSLLLAVLASQLLGAAGALLRNAENVGLSRLFPALLLPMIVIEGLSADVSSPSLDIVALIYGVVIFTTLMRCIDQSLANSPDDLFYHAAVATLLCVAGCTIKLSFVPFGAATIAVIFILVARSLKWKGRRGAGRFLACAIMSALAWSIPHVAHGIILSGYPAYPNPMLGLPVDWRVPKAKVRESAGIIYAWARMPKHPWREVMASSDWIVPWCSRVLTKPRIALPLALAAGGLVLIASGRSRQKKSDYLSYRHLLPATPPLIGLTFWFLTAPDPRFGDWMVCLLAAYFLSLGLLLNRSAKGRLLPAVVIGCVTIACCVIPFQLVFTPIGIEHGFTGIPESATRMFTTDSDFRLLIPADKEVNQLWDAPLPSMTYPVHDLELRGATIAEGFRMRENFPPRKTAP